MARLTLLAGLLATIITRVRGDQPNVPGYEYLGCVEADIKQFPVVVEFFQPFRADQCVPTCNLDNYTFAALGAGCRCSDSEYADPLIYAVVDESLCPVPCIAGDESAGHCGGEIEDGLVEEYFNLYRRYQRE